MRVLSVSPFSRPRSLTQPHHSISHSLCVCVCVCHTGAVSVLAFLVPPNPGQNGAPLKSLVGFEKTFLRPNESRTFTFPVSAHDLTLVNAAGMRRVVSSSSSSSSFDSGVWRFEINPDAAISVPIRVL